MSLWVCEKVLIHVEFLFAVISYLQLKSNLNPNVKDNMSYPLTFTGNYGTFNIQFK